MKTKEMTKKRAKLDGRLTNMPSRGTKASITPCQEQFTGPLPGREERPAAEVLAEVRAESSLFIP